MSTLKVDQSVLGLDMSTFYIGGGDGRAAAMRAGIWARGGRMRGGSAAETNILDFRVGQNILKNICDNNMKF